MALRSVLTDFENKLRGQAALLQRIGQGSVGLGPSPLSEPEGILLWNREGE